MMAKQRSGDRRHPFSWHWMLGWGSDEPGPRQLCLRRELHELISWSSRRRRSRRRAVTERVLEELDRIIEAGAREVDNSGNGRPLRLDDDSAQAKAVVVTVALSDRTLSGSLTPTKDPAHQKQADMAAHDQDYKVAEPA